MRPPAPPPTHAAAAAAGPKTATTGPATAAARVERPSPSWTVVCVRILLLAALILAAVVFSPLEQIKFIYTDF